MTKHAVIITGGYKEGGGMRENKSFPRDLNVCFCIKTILNCLRKMKDLKERYPEIELPEKLRPELSESTRQSRRNLVALTASTLLLYATGADVRGMEIWGITFSGLSTPLLMWILWIGAVYECCMFFARIRMDVHSYTDNLVYMPNGELVTAGGAVQKDSLFESLKQLREHCATLPVKVAEQKEKLSDEERRYFDSSPRGELRYIDNFLNSSDRLIQNIEALLVADITIRRRQLLDFDRLFVLGELALPLGLFIACTACCLKRTYFT